MIIAPTIRSKDAVEAADDDDREHFEPDQRDAEAAARDEGPQHTRRDRDHPCEHPNDQQVMVDVDTDRHRCLPIVGKGLQCHTGAAIPVKGADDGNAKGGDERCNQLIGRHRHAVDDDRIRRYGQRDAARHPSEEVARRCRFR